MLFALMRLAMLSYHREGDEPPEFRGKSIDMAGSFRNYAAQCLTLADYTKSHPFLIEALVFHLNADFAQARDQDISIWVMTGVVARLAMRSGYHRDSKMYPNITPFQGEMRRRVWTFVRQADLLFSFRVGLPSMIRSTDSDTELPRNLYDDDFDEDSKELPPSRQLSEPTTISYLITKGRLTYAFGRVVEQSSAISSAPYEKVMEIDADLRQARDLIPDHLQIRPMEECQADPVSLIMSRFGVSYSPSPQSRSILILRTGNNRIPQSSMCASSPVFGPRSGQSSFHLFPKDLCRLSNGAIASPGDDPRGNAQWTPA
jgi:hypothetical protein